MTAHELIEVESIKALKARYFRLVDTKQWQAWGNVFTIDGTLRVDQGVQTFDPPSEPESELIEGRDNIVEFASSNLAQHLSIHHGYMPEIEIVSDTQARGVWAMEDIIERDGQHFHGYGHYHETYRKEAGVWRISSSHLTRMSLVLRPMDQG